MWGTECWAISINIFNFIWFRKSLQLTTFQSVALNLLIEANAIKSLCLSFLLWRDLSVLYVIEDLSLEFPTARQMSEFKSHWPGRDWVAVLECKECQVLTKLEGKIGNLWHLRLSNQGQEDRRLGTRERILIFYYCGLVDLVLLWCSQSCLNSVYWWHTLSLQIDSANIKQ